VSDLTFDVPQAADDDVQFPATLPVLPLKETVVFPQSMTPLLVRALRRPAQSRSGRG
jgi:hypothetical protein